MGSPVVVASPRKSPSYNRRANKPLVEKKRRARINGCLGQLKSLILGAMQTEGTQVSRLEKADILEMTVKYLRHIQNQHVQPEVVTKFSAGYTECASEVIRYIDTVNCISPEVKAKLENHLVERLRGSVTQVPDLASQASHITPVTTETKLPAPAPETGSKFQTEIEIANKAAAEALKRPQAVMVPSCRSLPSVPVSPSHLKSDFQRSRQELNHVNYPAVRSQSTSPPDSFSASRQNTPLYSSDLERHSNSAPGSHISLSYTPAPTHYINSYGHEAYVSSTALVSRRADSVKSEVESYGTDLERPLHIHIPESPRVPSTPSPAFNLHGMSCQPHKTSPSLPSLDEAPPTILYGYHQPMVKQNAMDTEETPHVIDNGCNTKTADYEIATGSLYTQGLLYRHSNGNDVCEPHHQSYQHFRRAMPNTPSPPMLTRETPLTPQTTHNHLRNPQNFSEPPPSANDAHRIYTQEQTCFQRPAEPAYSTYQNNDVSHVTNASQYCDKAIADPYCSGQPNSRLNPSSEGRRDPCPPCPNQPTMNGPAPQPTAPSRQKDNSLSLLTLKRRILYGLGSGGEWTGQNKIIHNDIQCEARSARCKERELIVPSSHLCRVSVHCSAEDNLWRPW